jgi:hypothetical protein
MRVITREQLDDLRALGWVKWAIDRAPGWALSDDELVDRVRTTLSSDEREPVLRELSRRLPSWPISRHEELSQRLAALEATNRAPGKPAQETDRLLHRFLHQLASGTACHLAEACLESPRLVRKMAAWRFFGARELDIPTAKILADHARPELRRELLRVIAVHPEVLRHLDVRNVLAQVGEFYWRGRLLQTMIEDGADEAVIAIGADYPAEVIFAVRRAARQDLLEVVRVLVREHRDDPEVISGAIQTFGQFGANHDLMTAVDQGREMLARADRQYRALFGDEFRVVA